MPDETTYDHGRAVTSARGSRRALAIVAFVVLAAGCAAVATPPFPSAPGVQDPGIGMDPGSGTDPGTGIGNPGGGAVPDDPAGGAQPGVPHIVVPHGGLFQLRNASPYDLSSRIDGTGHVIVRVRWWGGIEPCDTLDSVLVDRSGNTFTLTVRIGSQPGPAVACIDIAQDTATLVDLGALPTGTYTVTASAGDAPPVEVRVP